MIDEGNNHGITIKKDRHGKIEFDIVVPAPNGALYACRFLWESEVSSVQLEVSTKLGIQKMHDFLGHKSADNTRVVANTIRWVITCGMIKPCVHCARSKAKYNKFEK